MRSAQVTNLQKIIYDYTAKIVFSTEFLLVTRNPVYSRRYMTTVINITATIAATVAASPTTKDITVLVTIILPFAL